MGVHMHMHHSLNCLVGPGGDGFDTTNMPIPAPTAATAPIPDAASAAQRAKLQAAVAQLKTGLAATDMAAAQKDATDASATIASAK